MMILSKTYIERCNQLLIDNPKDWDGVWVMKSKMRQYILKKITHHFLT